MKYLVDAQLPKRLARWLIGYGVDAVHTLELPDKNNTQDIDIIKLAEKEGLIIIYKDEDFIQYRLVKGVPDKLLAITTGNIINNKLIKLFEANFPTINAHFKGGAKVIELSNEAIMVHE